MALTPVIYKAHMAFSPYEARHEAWCKLTISIALALQKLHKSPPHLVSLDLAP